MPSIFDMFASQLGEGQLDQIAKQIGADRGKTQDAISMTLPALIEALSRKTEQSGGAEELHDRLRRESTPPRSGGGGGSMLDQLNELSIKAQPPCRQHRPHRNGEANRHMTIFCRRPQVHNAVIRRVQRGPVSQRRLRLSSRSLRRCRISSVNCWGRKRDVSVMRSAKQAA